MTIQQHPMIKAREEAQAFMDSVQHHTVAEQSAEALVKIAEQLILLNGRTEHHRMTIIDQHNRSKSR